MMYGGPVIGAVSEPVTRAAEVDVPVSEPAGSVGTFEADGAEFRARRTCHAECFAVDPRLRDRAGFEPGGG